MKDISLERNSLNVDNEVKRSHPVPYKHKKELTGEKPSEYKESGKAFLYHITF